MRNQRRLGYAANLNRILEVSTARYALLLNTDMYFDADEQCVTKMVRFMDAHPDCGLSGCRLYRPDGSFAFPARRFQTFSTVAARRLGLTRWLGKTIDWYLHREMPQDSVFDCDWLSGCFLMVRRKAVDQVGFLDVQFRKYFEDVDYCLRMARAGWRVMMNGRTYCYHLEQRASRNIFSKDAFVHLQSYLRMAGEMGPQSRTACSTQTARPPRSVVASWFAQRVPGRYDSARRGVSSPRTLACSDRYFMH